MTNPGKNRTQQLISQHLQRGDGTGWFETLYAEARAGTTSVPWARMEPDAQLIDWLKAQPAPESGRALVIGCGLGDDAEALAAFGYATTAFDIASSAIAACKERFPQTSVDYRMADLFKLPEDWAAAYDLVFESRTLQALPWDLTEAAVANIAAQVRPGGTLLVACMGREPEESRHGIPWPLSREDLALFQNHKLKEIRFNDYIEGGRRFFVEYRRDANPG